MKMTDKLHKWMLNLLPWKQTERIKTETINPSLLYDFLTPKEFYPKRFLLIRKEDLSGISGTGVVASGIEFQNGRVAMCWLTKSYAVGVYDNIRAVEEIHGHEGRTSVIWVD